MNEFKKVMGILWYCITCALVIIILCVAFDSDASKNTLSLSFLGLVMAVLTSIAFVHEN